VASPRYQCTALDDPASTPVLRMVLLAPPLCSYRAVGGPERGVGYRCGGVEHDHRTNRTSWIGPPEQFWLYYRLLHGKQSA
jgi:hypothetical protein